MKKTAWFVALVALALPGAAMSQDRAREATDRAADAVDNAARDAAYAADHAADCAVPEGGNYVVACAENEDSAVADNYPDYPQMTGDIQPVDVQREYPIAAVRAGQSGEVGYALKVGADGAIQSCVIDTPSEFSALNAATCPLVRKHATFEAARDENQKPVAADYSGAVYWAISQPEFASVNIRMAFDYTAQGDARNCQLVEFTGTPPDGFNMEDPCKNFGRGGGLFRDAEGFPVGKRVEVELMMRVSDPAATPEKGN